MVYRPVKKMVSFFLLVLFFCFPLLAEQKKTELSIATGWSPVFPVFSDVAKNFKKYTELMSAERLSVTIVPATKHKEPLRLFDLVKDGTYDMAHTFSYYWYGRAPNTVYFSTMPFSMTAREQQSWFYYGGGLELMQEIYEPHGLYSLLGGNTGAQMGGWFKKEINGVKDLEGLRMRIAGFAGDVLKKVGVKTMSLSSEELYTALDRNRIDAVEFVGPMLDLSMGFHKIAPYYYKGWHDPGAEAQFLINKKKLDLLPEDLKQIVINASRLAAWDMHLQAEHESSLHWDKISVEYPNIKVRAFPNEIIAVLKKANAELLEEKRKEDAMAKKIIDSRQSYFEKIRPWTMTSEYYYLETMKE